jgi:hypothetical protein
MPPGSGGGRLGTGSQRTPAWLWLAGGSFVLLIALVIAASVSRPEPSVFGLSRLEAREPPTGLAGPDTMTLDARDGESWVRFDLERGTVSAPGEAWDLAVKRYRLAINGGEGFHGRGGVVRLGRSFEEVIEAPAEGYAPSRVTGGGDTVNAVLDGWYAYSWLSHLLRPEPGTFVIRTHDGRYAKLAVLGYYCPGPEPGCLTIEVAYQGDGSRRLAP